MAVNGKKARRKARGTLYIAAALLFVLMSETTRQELHESGTAMLLALLLAGNIVFLLYDLVLRRLRPLYERQVQPVLRKILR